MTRYLARDFFLKGSNITINAYHPGLISTNLGNNSSDEKKVKSVSEKGYSFEKAQKLMDYCLEKIKLFKEKQDF